MKFLQRIPTWLAAVLFLGTAAIIPLVPKAWAISNAASPGKFTCRAVQVATASATLVSSGTNERNGFIIQNNGPNAMACGGVSTVTTATGLLVPANGGVLTADIYGTSARLGNVDIYCIALTALQVSPADTRVCEGY